MRRSEWVLAGFFVYSAMMSIVLPIPGHLKLRTIATSTIAILIVAVCIRLNNAARDWVAAVLLPLAYRQMGWMARSRGNFTTEESWVRFDRLILGDWHVKSIIESLGAFLPTVLEVSYILVWPMLPVALGLFYAYHRRERIERFLLPFVLTVLGTYALFPLIPSEPPWAVFRGDLSPAYITPMHRLNQWLLGNYGIHTGVFPSAHVSGAFGVALGIRRVLPEANVAGWLLMLLATLIAIATVYCRYHYAVDALAGFCIALLVHRRVS